MYKCILFLSSKIWYIAFFLLTALTLFPLIHNGFVVTDDGGWLIIRLSAFYQALRDGQFPTRFLGRLNNGYGYPVSNFLYPLYLYIGSILHVFIKDYVLVIKIIMGGSIIFGLLGLYLFMRTIFSKNISLLTLFVYLGSPYLLYTTYVRGSVGELICISLISWLMYLTQKKSRVLAGLCFGFVLLSHNSMAAIFSVIYVLYILISRNKISMVNFLIGIGVSSFFWIPALAEKNITKFQLVDIANISDHRMITLELYFMSIVIPLIALVFVGKRIKYYAQPLISIFFIVVTVTLVIGMSFTNFWHVLHLDRYLQFPYRVLGLYVVILPLLFGILLSSVKPRIELYLKLSFILFAYISVVNRINNIEYSYYPSEYYSTNEASTTVADEYMPIWVKQIPVAHVEEKIKLDSNNATYSLLTNTSNKLVANINSIENTRVRINTVYYPGWVVYINNKEIPVKYENPGGLIEFLVPEGDIQIIAEFKETFIRKIANSLTAATFISMLLYCLYILSRRKGKPALNLL